VPHPQAGRISSNSEGKAHQGQALTLDLRNCDAQTKHCGKNNTMRLVNAAYQSSTQAAEAPDYPDLPNRSSASETER
jgi:hypothetical protein